MGKIILSIMAVKVGQYKLVSIYTWIILKLCMFNNPRCFFKINNDETRYIRLERQQRIFCFFLSNSFC